jgi:hypothetical protein
MDVPNNGRIRVLDVQVKTLGRKRFRFLGKDARKSPLHKETTG